MTDAIKLALDKCEKAAIESGAHESYQIVRESFAELRTALAALRAQPDHSYEFPSAPKHHDLIAELRRPMHYLSMAKRNRAADALEGKAIGGKA